MKERRLTRSAVGRNEIKISHLGPGIATLKCSYVCVLGSSRVTISHVLKLLCPLFEPQLGVVYTALLPLHHNFAPLVMSLWPLVCGASELGI